MKKIIKPILFCTILPLCSLVLVSCENYDQEPEFTPKSGKFILPDPKPLTPEQTEVLRQIVAEYNEAVG